MDSKSDKIWRHQSQIMISKIFGSFFGFLVSIQHQSPCGICTYLYYAMKSKKNTFMVTILEIIFHCACCCFCCKPVKNSYLISKHVFCQWLCSFRTPKKIFLGFHLGCFSITSCTFFLLDASWTIDLDIDGRLRSDLAKTLVYLCANLPKNEVHSYAMTILCVPLHMALTTAKIWKIENSF